MFNVFRGANVRTRKRTYYGTNKDYVYSKKLGFYILKPNAGLSKLYRKFSSNFGAVGGLTKDYSPIKITTRQLVKYINLVFSGRVNPVVHAKEIRKELDLSPDRFLHIRTNLEKLCREHGLIQYLEEKRRGVSARETPVTMKEERGENV